MTSQLNQSRLQRPERNVWRQQACTASHEADNIKGKID